jgi:hypothetical protein
MSLSKVFLAATTDISNNCGNPEQVLAAMRHTMKQTVKLLNAYHVADLFGDILRKKLPTTSVESLCCKLCMGLPSGQRRTLINTIIKWKQNDAWNVVRTERYNNTKIWRENRPILDEENVTHTFNVIWEKEKNRYRTTVGEEKKKSRFLAVKVWQMKRTSCNKDSWYNCGR